MYAYDAAGNLTSKTDRKGQTIEYVYHALKSLREVIDLLRKREHHSHIYRFCGWLLNSSVDLLYQVRTHHANHRYVSLASNV